MKNKCGEAGIISQEGEGMAGKLLKALVESREMHVSAVAKTGYR
jgi:hypothetical protein